MGHCYGPKHKVGKRHTAFEAMVEGSKIQLDIRHSSCSCYEQTAIHGKRLDH